MSKNHFYSILKNEVERIDGLKTTKRHENIIEGFTDHPAPRAIIAGQEYRVFNSNDYLGLRFNPDVQKAEHEASLQYGAGPGAVRFISGTMKVHIDLEKALADFHNSEDAMVFSSAFAANIAVISCLIKGQSKDSVVSDSTLVISDALNHRSIIEGIRVANLPSTQKKIYPHFDYQALDTILSENKGTYKRALVITDGVFSMLGEYADLKKISEITKKYDGEYEEGVLLVVDDSHGVGAFGKTGRGCEEVSGADSDVLVGTLGKAFGTDGGYVVGDKMFIEYLRESAATYIYSNPISPSVAGSALQAVQIVDSAKGTELLESSKKNIEYFQTLMKESGFTFAVESVHPIQPILIGDTGKTKSLIQELYKSHILATNISYPVVPPGRDEIRVQISAAHTKEDIEYFVQAITKAGKTVGL